MTNFFGDPLVWPAVVYFVGYLLVWITALVLGQLYKNRVSIERAAAIAWGVALSLHIIGGTALIIWLWERAHNRYGEWMYTILYLLFYIVIMFVDGCLLFSLFTKKTKKTTTNVSTSQTTGKSLNPKKKQ